jgi:cytochrome c-type biogenesis protein CcmF
MIPEIGHFALLLALAVAFVQSLVPLAGAARNDTGAMAAGAWAAIAQFALLALSFACLTHAYIVSDFSVINVAENSHSAKPLLYRITGVWGNHEGSMLLWVLILALFGAGVASFGANLPDSLRARVLAVQGMVGLAFLTFIIFTSNPFLRLDPAPPDGNGLNPVLQDPGLAFHPPFLYLGYVGFSVVFAFAVAALIEGRVDPAWARWVRPWTLAAWISLTIGISLGSWWAYYELGWGGFWFWDPVENASFMPWLIGTALLHSAIVAEKRDALKSWTILLALLAFALSLVGTFLVRSGVLTSVHSFAVDPTRGTFILVILVLAVGGSFALYAWRAPMLKAGGLFAPVSREGGLVLNNLLLVTACATVFLGTLYPLFLEAITGARVSVGPPYFNATFLPLMVPLLVAVAIGPLLGWKRADLGGALSRLAFAGAATLLAVLATAYFRYGGPVLALLGMGLAAWLVVGSLSEFAERIRLFRAPIGESLTRARGMPRATWGMTIAHAGLGLVVAGITATSAWQSERVEVLRIGETVEIAGYTLRLRGIERADGSNYQAVVGQIELVGSGEMLHPEKRFFTVQGQTTSEAAIRTNWFADLYVVLGDPTGSEAEAARGQPVFLDPARATGAWTVRAYHNPLAPWIWIGAIIMALGGAVSLSDRRLRVGAPARRRNPAEAAAD